MLSATASSRPYEPWGRKLATMVKFLPLKFFGLSQAIYDEDGSLTRSENNFLKGT